MIVYFEKCNYRKALRSEIPISPGGSSSVSKWLHVCMININIDMINLNRVNLRVQKWESVEIQAI